MTTTPVRAADVAERLDLLAASVHLLRHQLGSGRNHQAADRTIDRIIRLARAIGRDITRLHEETHQ